MYYSHLDVKDIEEFPEPEDFSRQVSDFFFESYPLVFPESYTQEVYNFFRYVIHPYRRCWDTPAASPRNEEIEAALRNKGKKGSHTFDRDGRKFVVSYLQDWMFHPQRHYRRHYYTSDRRRALLYFDVDRHKAYQTPAMGKEAQRIIEQECQHVLGVAPAFVGSNRGENGYLKVNIDGSTPEAANRVFDELQDAIRLLLVKHGNLADFEIKGTLTWMDCDGKLHGGRYGKLPMSSPDWSYKWFDVFRRSRAVTLDGLKRLIAKIKAEVTEEDVRRHEAERHRAVVARYLPVGRGQRWRLSAEFGSWWVEEYLWTYRGREWVAKSLLNDALIEKLWRDYRRFVAEPEEKNEAKVRPDQQAILALEAGQQAVDEKNRQPEAEAPAPARKPFRSLGRLADEPDSYKRQQDALLVFARSLKRVPTVKEALDYIKAHSLFTGAWQANLPRRKARVKYILKRIARTFDHGKCKIRAVEVAKLQAWASANANKYDAWAKKKFPKGIIGGKKFVGEEGEIFQQRLHVGPQFIGVFIAVCEFGLLADKNPDDSLPHERAKETWKVLHKKGLASVPFCARKWAVCREEMVRYGIVNVTDRDYHADKAMKWAVGRFFPGLGLWKAKKAPSGLPPITSAEFAQVTRSTQQEEPNTLLRQQSNKTVLMSYHHPIRPPPTFPGA